MAESQSSAFRSRACIECGVSFTYQVGLGRDRSLCSEACGKARRKRKHDASRERWSECEVEGCGKPIRSARATMCEAHYARVRRNGTLELAAAKQKYSHSSGYVKLRIARSHPLAIRLGDCIEYEHRVRFFDAHGGGPFECHWCNKSVSWDDMHVDHVNAVRDDNRLENLVASCAPCNQARGKQKAIATTRERRANWIEWNGLRLTENQWSERIGISRSSIRARLAKEWSVERTLTEPRGVYGPPSGRGGVQP